MKVLVAIGKEFLQRVEIVCVSIVCVVITRHDIEVNSHLGKHIHESVADGSECVEVDKLPAIHEVAQVQYSFYTTFFAGRKEYVIKKLEVVV